VARAIATLAPVQVTCKVGLTIDLRQSVQPYLFTECKNKDGCREKILIRRNNSYLFDRDCRRSKQFTN